MRHALYTLSLLLALISVCMASNEEEFKRVSLKPLMFSLIEDKGMRSFRFDFPLYDYDIVHLNKVQGLELSFRGKDICLKGEDLKRFAGLKSLVEICLENCPYDQNQLLHLFSNVKDLASVDLTRMTLSKPVLNAIAENSPELVHLRLEDCNLQASDLTKLLRTLQNLSFLEITNCPYLEKDAIMLLGQNPDLVILRSGNCRILTAEKK